MIELTLKRAMKRINYTVTFISFLCFSFFSYAENSCVKQLSDIGISVVKSESLDGFTIVFDSSKVEDEYFQPAFSYLTYKDQKGGMLKVPVFDGKSSQVAGLMSKNIYSVNASESFLPRLSFETFFYPKSGGEGKYLFITGFTNIQNLKCSVLSTIQMRSMGSDSEVSPENIQ